MIFAEAKKFAQPQKRWKKHRLPLENPEDFITRVWIDIIAKYEVRTADKHVIARQLDALMEEERLSKTALAKRMKTSRVQLGSAPSEPPRETLNICGGSDYAVTSHGGDYTVHSCQIRCWCRET